MQSVERIFLILNILAACPADGMRPSDLSRKSGLDKATTLRILNALFKQRIVKKVLSPDGKKGILYQLGNQLVFLGLAAQRTFTMDDLLRPALQRLSEKTEDTCFVTVRSGYHSFCLLREIGSYPIQIRSLPVGACRPLGVGGGGGCHFIGPSRE